MNDIFGHNSETMELPRRLGNYELTELLGRGGMGEVYLAYNIELKEPAAVKLLPKHLSSDTSFVNRFREEARKLRRLNHPNIVQAHDFGRDGNDFYLVMEHIDGGDLQEIIDQYPEGIGPELTQKYMLQIVAAVREAHKTTVHRDLSPNNILMTKEGKVKVSDFGLSEVVGEEFARSLIQKSVTLSQVGIAETLPAENSRKASNIVGKVRYMSPQVTRGEPSDKRNDIYALGIMLYDMLTGRTTGMIRSIAKEKPDLDRRWQAIFDRCTADDIASRYQAIDELEADLKALSVTPTKKSPVGKIAALLVLGGLGFAGYWFRADWLPTVEPYIAQVKGMFQSSLADKPSGSDSKPQAAKPSVTQSTSAAKPANPAWPVTLQMTTPIPEGSTLTLINPRPSGVPTSFNSAANVQLPKIDSDYTMRFEHPDYRSDSFTIPGVPGKHPVRVNLVQLRRGLVYTIESEPQGAEVFSGGASIGFTPLNERLYLERKDENLPYDPIELQLALEGYETSTLRIGESTPKVVPTIELQAKLAKRRLQLTLPGGVQMEATYIDKGTGTIGSPENEQGRIAHSETQHSVNIEKPFYIGIHEVTQEQYKAIMGSNPSFYIGDTKPVDQVMYRELNSEEGFLKKFTQHLQANGYAGWVADLPTNEEWEYATRAGTVTTFYNGKDITNRGRDTALDSIAVYLTIMTANVGTKEPNEWGLYDTLGNVFEWTKEGDLRGGSFKQQATTTRPAYRLIGKTDRTSTDKDANQFGFRVVLRPPNS